MLLMFSIEFFSLNQITHTGKKPYKCNQCDEALTVKMSLEIHQRTHSGRKPYTCSQCDKTFTIKQFQNTPDNSHLGKTISVQLMLQAVYIKKNLAILQ